MKGREDLRVVKTREAIRDAFQTMICEMDYDQIMVKELARRARIKPQDLLFSLHRAG